MVGVSSRILNSLSLDKLSVNVLNVNKLNVRDKLYVNKKLINSDKLDNHDCNCKNDNISYLCTVNCDSGILDNITDKNVIKLELDKTLIKNIVIFTESPDEKYQIFDNNYRKFFNIFFDLGSSTKNGSIVIENDENETEIIPFKFKLKPARSLETSIIEFELSELNPNKENVDIYNKIRNKIYNNIKYIFIDNFKVPRCNTGTIISTCRTRVFGGTLTKDDRFNGDYVET
jgi:hypothetical protein